MVAMDNQTPFDAILVSIVAGKFKPGERLVERDLVARFGVSRTPVREAIRKLESLGIVRCFPNRGAIVADLSPTDIEDLYFVRLHQERLAARLAFYNLGAEEIGKLQNVNRELQLALKKRDNICELIEKDREFHQTIFRASKNKFLIQVIDDLRMKCYTIAYHAWTGSERVFTSIEEHKEMIKALKQRNRERFQNLIEHQLVAAKMSYLDSLQ
jgi:DNA-binding GntR family transcriptional regulator